MALADSFATIDDFVLRVDRRILDGMLDWNEDSKYDGDVLQVFLNDGATLLRERLAGIYELPTQAPYPASLVRLNVTLTMAMIAERYPEYTRWSSTKLRATVDKEIEQIRMQHSRLAQAPPDPAANVGGDIGPIGDNPDPNQGNSIFDNLGDW